MSVAVVPRLSTSRDANHAGTRPGVAGSSEADDAHDAQRSFEPREDKHQARPKRAELTITHFNLIQLREMATAHACHSQRFAVYPKL
jgi:hypothetical protein